MKWVGCFEQKLEQFEQIQHFLNCKLSFLQSKNRSILHIYIRPKVTLHCVYIYFMYTGIYERYKKTVILIKVQSIMHMIAKFYGFVA